MALFTVPTASRSALPSSVLGGSGGGSAVREDTGAGGRATENAQGRKTAPVTCISCGHGPTPHDDGHRAYWVREAD